MIKGYLKKLNIKPIVKNNGKKALDHFTNSDQDFQLILLDCEMPIMDGIEAARQIQASERFQQYTNKPKIVFISAYTTQDTIDKAKQAGSTLFLVKPLKLKDLTTLLNQLFDIDHAS